MVTEVEIKCINKTDRQSAQERIKNVGGVNPDSQRWKLAQEAGSSPVSGGSS